MNIWIASSACSEKSLLICSLLELIGQTGKHVHGSEGMYPRLVSLFVSRVAKNVFISFLKALYNYLASAFQAKQVLCAVFRSCDVLSWIRGVTLKSYAYGEWTFMPDIERHCFASATPVGQMPRTTLGTKTPGQSCEVRPGSPGGP